ncbi:MAG: LrgB family protein [Clostridia bacterium]|nr:LrgB family protein [Clostridia bacterium]
MLDQFTSAPIFGFTLCVVSYIIGLKVKQKFNYPIANPMIIAAILIIGILLIFKIPLENFMRGGAFVSMLLAPATAALALSMYRQIEIIKKNLIPILVGCVVGVVSALVSIIVLCKLFGISDEITASLIPKSITTAIATQLSIKLGGMAPVTVAAVAVTGIFGAVASPYLIRWSRINNSVAAGLAIGASSHALGTSKAIEIGEVEGSVSGIAVGLCGIITVILAIFL